MKKKRRRRPRKNSFQARLKRNLFFVVVGAVLLIWGVVFAVSWPGFRPRQVDVVGVVRVDPQLVRHVAGIQRTDNIWLLNPWQIATRVETIPWVLSLALERSWPNRVRLLVTERRPESCLVWARGKVTIDAQQRVLEDGCQLGLSYLLPTRKTARLGSMITDPELSCLRNDVAVVSAAHFSVQTARFDRDGNLVMVLNPGVSVLFGDDSLIPQTSALLGPIFAAVKKQGHEADQIDLRAPNTPVVRYKDTLTVTPKVRGRI